MATCIRSGIRWSRHKYKLGKCKRCGVSQEEMLRALANRRERRRLARLRRKLEVFDARGARAATWRITG